MKLKAVLQRMLGMGPDAWYIFFRGLQLCCALLFCAFMLLLEWDGDMAGKHGLYTAAVGLNESAQSVLLLAILGSVCVEDYQRDKS